MVDIVIKGVVKENITKTLRYVVQDLARIQQVIPLNGEKIGEELLLTVKKAIAEKHPIGNFMGPRTSGQVKVSRSSIEILISGIPENELKNDAYDHDKIEEWESGLTNDLWSVQEHGAAVMGKVWQPPQKIVFPAEEVEGSGGGLWTPEGAAGTYLARQSRRSFNVSEYKGYIAERILPELRITLVDKAKILTAALVMGRIVRDVAEGSAHQASVDVNMPEVYRAAKISPTKIKQAGIIALHIVSSTGQVIMQGNQGRFVSPPKLGLPTSIRKGNSTVTFKAK